MEDRAATKHHAELTVMRANVTGAVQLFRGPLAPLQVRGPPLRRSKSRQAFNVSFKEQNPSGWATELRLGC